MVTCYDPLTSKKSISKKLAKANFNEVIKVLSRSAANQ